MSKQNSKQQINRKIEYKKVRQENKIQVKTITKILYSPNEFFYSPNKEKSTIFNGFILLLMNEEIQDIHAQYSFCENNLKFI